MSATEPPTDDGWRPWPAAMDVTAVDVNAADVRVVIQGVHDEGCYWAYAFRGGVEIAFTKSLSVARAYGRLLDAIRGRAAE